MSYGIPVEDAYDTDTDPDNRDAPYVLEPYSYVDHAAKVVRRAQARLEQQYDEHANDDRVWAVRKRSRSPLSS